MTRSTTIQRSQSAKEKNHGNDNTTPFASFHTRDCDQKIRLAEDGWNTPDAGKVLCIRDRFTRRNSLRCSSTAEMRSSLSLSQVGRELDYRLIQGTVGVHRESHRGALCLRVARRFGHWYALAARELEFNDDGLMAFRSRRSTTFRSLNQIANIIGRWASSR